MHDRAQLNRFLKDAGFAGAGDLVFLDPERSATREVRASERSVVVTISTRARDRHGDVVDPEGVRLARFRKNPVVLYAHDYDGLPVARSLWEKVRDGELVAKPQFHLETELSREVWALVEKGVLSAWSVGFLPEAWEPMPKEHGGGFRVRKWDLLEYSSVPVPANFEALTRELEARRITAPVLVKTLAPLGLRAPDLVDVGAATETDHRQDARSAEDDGETNDTDHHGDTETRSSTEDGEVGSTATPSRDEEAKVTERTDLGEGEVPAEPNSSPRGGGGGARGACCVSPHQPPLPATVPPDVPPVIPVRKIVSLDTADLSALVSRAFEAAMRRARGG